MLKTPRHIRAAMLALDRALPPEAGLRVYTKGSCTVRVVPLRSLSPERLAEKLSFSPAMRRHVTLAVEGSTLVLTHR